MKIPKVFYQTKVMFNFPNGEYQTLGGNLEDELTEACETFIKGDFNNLLERTRELAIAERTALNHYLTGIKIQNFAINAAENDNIKLNEEVNSFLKQYDKLVKE